jgi:hypothetical protein
MQAHDAKDSAREAAHVAKRNANEVAHNVKDNAKVAADKAADKTAEKSEDSFFMWKVRRPLRPSESKGNEAGHLSIHNSGD